MSLNNTFERASFAEAGKAVPHSNRDETPRDTNCYCDSCEYMRSHLDKVIDNFYYGFVFFPLWCYNCLLLLISVRKNSDYQFSENIKWQHRDEITLLGVLEDGNNITNCVIKEHVNCRRKFSRWIGYSAIAFLTEGVLLGLIVLLLTSSSSPSDHPIREMN